MQISRGKPDRLHRTPAESTALALMDTGLRRSGPARPTRDASYSVSVRQVAALLPRFFQAAPRGHHPCASLALRLHQTLGRGLAPPSCQTCSAHPEPWTRRPRPPRLGKRPNRVFHSDHGPRLHKAVRSLVKRKRTDHLSTTAQCLCPMLVRHPGDRPNTLLLCGHSVALVPKQAMQWHHKS